MFTKAAIALHNFLQTTEPSLYCPSGWVDGEDGAKNLIDGAWRAEDLSGFSQITRVGSNSYSRTAAEMREYFKEYFNSTDGEVSWQYAYVRRTN